jgi:chromate transport protein ChrA
MENWIILLSVAVCILVLALTIHFYRKNENGSGKQSRATAIVFRYWQAIVMVTVGVTLLIVTLLI